MMASWKLTNNFLLRNIMVDSAHYQLLVTIETHLSNTTDMTYTSSLMISKSTAPILEKFRAYLYIKFQGFVFYINPIVQS